MFDWLGELRVSLTCCEGKFCGWRGARHGIRCCGWRVGRRDRIEISVIEGVPACGVLVGGAGTMNGRSRFVGSLRGRLRFELIVCRGVCDRRWGEFITL